MSSIIQDKLKDMVDLWKIRGVRHLALFGSAATDSFDQFSSDLDLIVEFKPMAAQHADNYFGLIEDLQRLFGVSIDLIEMEPIPNPFFRQAVAETRVVLYEAAWYPNHGFNRVLNVVQYKNCILNYSSTRTLKSFIW